MGCKRFFVYFFFGCAFHSQWCKATHGTTLHKRFTLQPASSSFPQSTNSTAQNPPTNTSSGSNHSTTTVLPGNPTGPTSNITNATGTAVNHTGVIPTSANQSSLNPISSNHSTSPKTLPAVPPAPLSRPIDALSIPPSPSQPDSSCEKVPLTVASWKQLKIDDYLKSYPGGSTKDLATFAADHGAYNFLCGLGESCHAGQLCSPITGPAWYVLFASQQFNVFQQSLYDAIGFVSSEATATGAQLVADLFPPVHKKKAFHLFKVGMILTLMAAVAASLACAVFIWVPGLQALAVASAVAASTAIASTSTILASEAEAKKAANEDSFTRWAHYASEISTWQTNTQNSIGDNVQKHITAGVSTDQGIYGVIKNGQFGYNVGVQDLQDLEKGYREVVIARMVSEMLKSKEGFVTVGSTGPGGAFPAEEGWLSFCDSHGTMMNIIAAHDDKADNSWPTAATFALKYGLSVEYLTTQSVNCQKKYGFQHDPYVNGVLPVDKNSECLVNLLVCDCTLPGMSHARKKDNTVHACRHKAGVPV